MTLCECGCGRETTIATRNMRSRGWVKGEPIRFIQGHATRGRTTDHGHTVEDRGYSTPCWIWAGPVLANGYGWWSGQYAHRRAYGVVPPGLHVDHLCDVRLCVNPAHLEAVTQAENNRRVWLRGRRVPAGAAMRARRASL